MYCCDKSSTTVGNALRGVPNGGRSCCSWNAAEGVPYSRAAHRGRIRRGQALVEFAVVCLAVYLLLAAILTFGQWLYSAQGLQQAVDVAAREISRTPLPAALTSSGGTMTLSYALTGDWTQDPSLKPVRQQVFDDNLLVLAIDPVQSGTGGMTFNGGHPIGDFPIVTQQLMPLMVNDQVNGQPLLRFPGAMFQSSQQGDVAGGDLLQRLRGANPRRQRRRLPARGKRSSTGCNPSNRFWIRTGPMRLP